jgi:hypothetical protein
VAAEAIDVPEVRALPAPTIDDAEIVASTAERVPVADDDDYDPYLFSVASVPADEIGGW